MKIKQAIFTSCLRGIEDKRGVCLYSMSEGMNPESIKRFEKNSIYQKYYQNQDEIEDLPVAFFCGKDSTGAFYIQQNKSILDYGENGREGNVLCQMMLLEEQELLPEVPISYFKSAEFRKEMDEREVSSQERPEYLPQLDYITPNENLSFEKICQEFLDDVEKIETLFQLITTLFSCKKEKKRLVICGSQEEIVFWIAAIEYAFPAIINRNISFSTYIYDVEKASYDICGYIPGVSDIQKQENYYNIFFYPGRRFKANNDIGYGWFGNLKMSYLTNNYEYIEQFNQFLMQIGFDRLNEEIYLAYEVYSILESGCFLQNKRFSVNEILEFTKQNLSDADKCEMVLRLLQAELGKEKNQIIRGCVELLEMIDRKRAIKVLCKLDMESRKEERVADLTALSEVWEKFFVSEITRSPDTIECLYRCIFNNTERYALLQKLELENLGANPFSSFQRSYAFILKNGGADTNRQLETMMNMFIQNISESIRMNQEQKWNIYIQLFSFCGQNRIFNVATDQLVRLIDRYMPIIDEKINVKLKKQKREREEEHGSAGGHADIHLLATGVFNYRGVRKINGIFRSDLYVLGYSLWKMTRLKKDFDFMTDKSIISDCYALKGIDVTSLSNSEFEKYIQWIIPALSKLVFTQDRIEFIFKCFVMTVRQKVILIDKIADVIFESFDGKTSIGEVGSMIVFCSTEPEIYYDILCDILRELKKSEMEKLKKWIEIECLQNPEVLKLWKRINNGMEKKGGLLNKLFWKK